MAPSDQSFSETAQPYLDTLAALSPLIRETAPRAEKRGRLDENLIAHLKDHRFFRLWLPRTYDGDEVDLPASCLVCEAASYEDGATGWTVMIGAGGGLFAATLDSTAAHEIFNDPGAVIAGSGTPLGTARRVDSGYRVDGRWPYASGAYHATWFTANTIIHDAGQPLRDEAGNPIVRAMAFPADAVEIIPTWDTTGMRASASEDIVIRDRFVPAYRSFDVFGPPKEDGVLYRYPFMALTQLSTSSVGLGIARRALDEWSGFVSTKIPLGGGPVLAEQPLMAIRFAEATIRLSTARAYWWEQLTASWATVAAGKTLDEEANTRIRLAAHNAAAGSAAAVDLLHEVSGMLPLFTGSAFGRCWRDVHAVTQHAAVAPSNLEPSGRSLLGLPPA